jgi:hypothetical protein
MYYKDPESEVIDTTADFSPKRKRKGNRSVAPADLKFKIPPFKSQFLRYYEMVADLPKITEFERNLTEFTRSGIIPSLYFLFISFSFPFISFHFLSLPFAFLASFVPFFLLSCFLSFVLLLHPISVLLIPLSFFLFLASKRGD